jgi:hypothetical protein
MNAYRSFRTQAEAKAWAVAFVAQRADQGLEIVKVVRILSLGEVVRCLEGSGYGEHQLEAAKEVMTKRRARVEALEAAAAEGAALADAEMVGKGLADPAVLAQPVVVGGAAIEPAPKTRTIWSVVQITAGQRQSWTYSTLQQAEGAFVTACEQHASLKVDLTRWTEGLPGEVLVKRFERDDVSKKELLEVLQRVMTQITTIGSMDMRTYEAATSLLNRHAGSTALVKGA